MARRPFAGVTALAPLRAAIERFRSRQARPPVDLRDDPHAYTLVVDLPGVEPAAVELTVSGRTLDLRARTASEAERVEGGYLVRERRAGVFVRRLTLPDPVDPGSASAQLEAGRLTVRLPKLAPEPARRIPIRVGGAANAEQAREAA